MAHFSTPTLFTHPNRPPNCPRFPDHPTSPAGEGAGAPRRDTTTNHVPSRRSPHRAWGPSKNPQDPSGQLSTPGSAPRKDTTTNHVTSRSSPHWAWEPSKDPHDPSWQLGTPGSAGALAGPSLHSGHPLPTGNIASLAIRASPAHDGPPVHSSLVHPPRLTAKLSALSTPPHIPCRRGRRRSQESHLVSARRPLMTRPPIRIRNPLGWNLTPLR